MSLSTSVAARDRNTGVLIILVQRRERRVLMSRDEYRKQKQALLEIINIKYLDVGYSVHCPYTMSGVEDGETSPNASYRSSPLAWHYTIHVRLASVKKQ